MKTIKLNTIKFDLDNFVNSSGGNNLTPEQIEALGQVSGLSLKVGDLDELDESVASDNLVGAINKAAQQGGGSMTYTAEEWKALSDEEKETAKQTYDTIYITGDVSDWCEKPTVATTYPSNNIPADNTIYNLGERAELTIASIPEHCCASITVTAGADGLTLGIGEGVKIIGSIPTIEASKEYFIGIVDGMLYVEEVSVYSTEEGA